jgi:hypothetical protein
LPFLHRGVLALSYEMLNYFEFSLPQELLGDGKQKLEAPRPG